ncbi:MAG: RNA polymerase sporulation sigma factor SigG [Clostridia bacterium]|nr:RNA polymerase sporulation sigma factor SigG [Clostridia bacterium]
MQYNKVEICGVNTSHLKVLSEEEKRSLLAVVKHGDKESASDARKKLIEGNLRLVLSVVQKFSNRGESPDDLFQVGCIGLMKAIDNFDDTLDVRFSTYGVPMIIGEVRRYLRDNSYIRVSRSVRDTAYRAMQAREKLQNTLSRDPTVEEIANEIDRPREDVVIALEAVVEPVSLYEPVFSDGTDTVYVMDQISDRNSESGLLEELSIKDAMNKLTEREKRILALRFYIGKTQMETAKEIGISQAQISRIEKGAIEKIRSS